ncbi:MAG: hypothetical protein E7261_11965 [Lachnospiraceae bacterium]|nr:hypothetical protein [Lachnospiraceae bacterium]
MINIHPKTYNEALRLSRCTELKMYVPKITDYMIEEMYHFISDNHNNIIVINGRNMANPNGVVLFIDADGNEVKNYFVEVSSYLNKIKIGASVYHVQRYEYSYSD